MLTFLLACTVASTDTEDSGSSGDTACPTDATAMVGGTAYDDDGRGSFVELDEGTALTMVHGPQGGWHVLASARAWGLDAIVSIHYTVDDETKGARVSDNTYRVQMVDDAVCGRYYPGMFGYLSIDEITTDTEATPPNTMAGDTLLLTMEISDTSGNAATDTLSGIATKDPADEE